MSSTTEAVVAGMSQIERLIALEDIALLRARRDQAIDTQNWDLYLSLHAPDHLSHNEGEEPRQGAKENVAGVARLLQGKKTVHHTHTPDITFESPVKAKGIWGMEDLIFDAETLRLELQGFGFYHELYEKRDGVWMFTYRQLRRTFVLNYR